MNERIKDLAEQAELPVIDGEWDYNDREILCQVDGEWRVATPSEIISVLFDCEKGREKFAQLIVRECVDIVSKVPNGYRDYRNQIEDAMRTDCLQAIQEHFGVKE